MEKGKFKIFTSKKGLTKIFCQPFFNCTFIKIKTQCLFDIILNLSNKKNNLPFKIVLILKC